MAVSVVFSSVATHSGALIHSYLGPGHFLEVRKILPLLTSDVSDQPSFHVVALSLPGFGFSEAPKKKGFAARQYAEVGVLWYEAAYWLS